MLECLIHVQYSRVSYHILMFQVLLKYMVGRGEPMIKAVMARANQSPHKTSIYLLGVLDFVKSAVASPDIQTR